MNKKKYRRIKVVIIIQVINEEEQDLRLIAMIKE